MSETYIFTVDVGFTTSRPIVPEEHVSRVWVIAASESEAHCVAAQMVCRPKGALWPEVQMPTSTRTVRVEV